MGLMQKAVETYDSHYLYASEEREGSAVLAPIGHTVTNAALEIVLDAEGNFINASVVDKADQKIIIPVTESSAGRTKGLCAHPLCDQVGYLIPENKPKYTLYVEQLADWEASEYRHPTLTAVLKYVRRGTVLDDLHRCGVITLNGKGLPEDEKKLVRWRVLGLEQEACWLDKKLFDAFTGYCIATHKGQAGLCMVEGKISSVAGQHPKGIIPIYGNAKLISANDFRGFTYLGRVSEDWQAASVSFEASQKAHNALRWLAQEQGVILGGRTFLCWNPQGCTVVQPTSPLLSRGAPVFNLSDYRDALKRALVSKKAELKQTDTVVIAAFDAATTGRLALTYYNELQGHDFLQRLHDWEASCCWPHQYFGIQSPSLCRIVNCAFGTQRIENGKVWMETDDRILGQQIQRMIACRVDKTWIGLDIVKALVDRASRPEARKKNTREEILFTACAVIRKNRADRFKEEWDMALEPERNDRSYQFGRLLAVMEKVERSTYGYEETREPNAIRMQSVFCQRPMYAAGILEKQLDRAYFPRLRPGSRIWYKNLMGQIMDVISSFPEEAWNKPLDDTYLMGYYLQRNAFYTNNHNDEAEENEG